MTMQPIRRPFEGGNLHVWTEVHKDINRIRQRVVQHDQNMVMDTYEICAELELRIKTLEQQDTSIPKNRPAAVAQQEEQTIDTSTQTANTAE